MNVRNPTDFPTLDEVPKIVLFVYIASPPSRDGLSFSDIPLYGKKVVPLHYQIKKGVSMKKFY